MDRPKEKGRPPAKKTAPETLLLDTPERSVSDRIQKYSFLKKQGFEITEHLADVATRESTKILSRLEACGTFLKFRDYYTVDKTRLVGANFCKQHLFCPLCAGRRASTYSKQYSEKIECLMPTLESKSSKSLNAFLITLTVPNTEELSESLLNLRSLTAKLFQRRRLYLSSKGARYPNTLFRNVEASVTAIEIKRGSGLGLWHPHNHGLYLTTDDWIDLDAARAEIYEIAQAKNIHVEKCDPAIAFAVHLREVLKYTAKFGDLTPADRILVAQAIKGMRLINSYGALRGFTPDESLLDDPLVGLPYLEQVYLWLGACYALYAARQGGEAA